ncbi:metallophosphoesterase (plasmid) [Paenibacillus thiaminolyticus]|uniref:AAA family ATPase n=1 Tax=Paenibacillus thiaminolyticus TaxID=49283 RepID=UPI0023303286|nr:AAA family ATPase [Paenibacillus thiaminolyticus]WCF11474.1 metallophosphoesterase [Paenibacillus thiaminolyticus]
MEIKTNVHTVFILVGPTECGKTTFVNKVLVPQLSVVNSEKNFATNVQVISSDQIRRDILGSHYDKHDCIMTEASVQAFDLLEKRLEAVTSFPINAEFVVVDTKGLSDEFRQNIANIAKRNNYAVEAIVFDYKDTQDYYLEGTKNRASIARDVRRLRSDVLSNLRRTVDRIHKVKAKDFLDNDEKAYEKYRVEIQNIDLYQKTILPASEQQEYFIVGDLHEEVEALKTVFQDRGFIVKGDEILRTPKSSKAYAILVGDIIDKGDCTAHTIRFIYKNRMFMKLVKGNHENFVYKYLKGDLKGVNIPANLIPEQFTSIQVLEQDAELRQMFFELVEEMVPFCRFIGIQKNSFYVTHAPCLNKYLGKIDPVSLKKQRNFLLNREGDIEAQLKFLEDEAVGNHPYHIFGHVTSVNGFRIKNKIGIDTGAVNGNRLTTVSIQGKLFFKSVPVSKAGKIELPALFKLKNQNVSLNELSDEDRRRMDYVLRNKINFISGTISPADKNEETGQLESLAKGLEYYKNNGISAVTLQPKYMGSRCTIYLGKTAEESYAVSRNGFKIRNVDLDSIYEKLIEKHANKLKDSKMIVLDGELMPWRALGKGLIEKQFKVIDVALRVELDFLKEYSFEDKFQSLLNSFEDSDFSKDQMNMSKKELMSKYGDATYGSFKNVRTAMKNHYPLSIHEDAIQKYHEQIELYGIDSEISFKPFALLKEIREDGTESFPDMSTSEMFSDISDDDFVVIDFRDKDYYQKANAFYLTLTTDQKMEGVVIKPEVEKEGVAPAIKVRNPEYLRIIYGYDYSFENKYRNLFSQKNIRSKLVTSISEHKLGKELLSFPIRSIEKNNREYQQVLANMLFETSKETGIDPRL